MPLRLVYVSHSFPPPTQPLANLGGMQRVATELYEALQRRDDVELHPLLLHTTWRMTHLRTVPFLVGALRTLPRRVRQHDADAVLFSSMVTAALSVPLRKTLHTHGVATAAIVHGRDVTLPVGPYQAFVPRVFEALDAVFPVSRATGEQCVVRGLPSEKRHVIPNGVRLDRFAEPPSRHLKWSPERLKDLRRLFQIELPAEGTLLCSVGRQVPRKGFAWFVDNVMPRLPSSVHYALAGEGPEADTIRAAIDKHGLAPRVHLLGRVTDTELTALYRRADLFIMPNRPVPGDMEGFGVVMLEAGANGLPSLAARLEGIRDVIAEGQNGHLIASGDADGFVQHIQHYHHHRDDLAALSGQAARYVRHTFSWEAVAGQYVKTLRDVSGA